ncbi:MAG: sigma-70 family RNA polymerase sigma factor [Oscillospiraceae bacterium]|nr:sigma-70 family RNA polymerase sigma factor [Oscillospiraceae bacterium]
MYLLNEAYAETSATAEENLGLVRLCAGRFKGKGIEYEELYSAGCIGLLKAVKSFDSTRGVRFSTYAVPVILGEIKRLFRDGGMIKVSRGLKERSLQIARARERFERENLREPTVEELADLTGLEPLDIAEAISVMQPTVSLTSGEDGETELDIPVPPPDDKIINSLALKQVLDKLDESDRALIQLRFFCGLTQQAVAAKLGCTQVQVSRREKKLLERLRSEL